MIARAIPGRPPARRGGWIVTLADLALLLVGFFVILHAFEVRPAREREQLAGGIRGAITGRVAANTPVAVAVEADVVDGFAPGDASLPREIGTIARWLRAAAADPRSHVVITGRSDGSALDRAEGSGVALAGRRADAVADALVAAGAVPASRMAIEAVGNGQFRRVDIAITYQPR